MCRCRACFNLQVYPMQLDMYCTSPCLQQMAVSNASSTPGRLEPVSAAQSAAAICGQMRVRGPRLQQQQHEQCGHLSSHAQLHPHNRPPLHPCLRHARPQLSAPTPHGSLSHQPGADCRLFWSGYPDWALLGLSAKSGKLPHQLGGCSSVHLQSTLDCSA